MDKLQDTIRPRLNDDTVTIPVSFNNPGGRSETNKTRKVLSWILGVVSILLSLLVLFGKGNTGFFARLIIIAIILTVSSLTIRFLLLREYKLRKEYYTQLENDYKLSTQDIWGIYDIEGEDLKFAHYRNGKIGMAFSLEKSVIVGTKDEQEFENFEAIADALKIAADNKATVIHVDYMSQVGKDSRFPLMYQTAAKTKNRKLRAAINSIYANLEEQLAEEISTYDVYFILVSSTNTQYREIGRKVIKAFLEANYEGYSSLDEEGLRKLTMELFNLESFSVVDAQRDALLSSTSSIAVPISITKGGVTTKLNDTIEERRAKLEEKQRLEELVKREKKRRLQEQKKNKKKNNKTKVVEELDDEEIEL